MHIHDLAAACRGGTWLQQWECGWRQPTTSAAHAGYIAGHDLPLAVAVAVVVLLAVRIARRRRAARRASPARAAPRTGAWR